MLWDSRTCQTALWKVSAIAIIEWYLEQLALVMGFKARNSSDFLAVFQTQPRMAEVYRFYDHYLQCEGTHAEQLKWNELVVILLTQQEVVQNIPYLP